MVILHALVTYSDYDGRVTGSQTPRITYIDVSTCSHRRGNTEVSVIDVMPLVYEFRVIERQHRRNGIVSGNPSGSDAFLKTRDPCIVLHSLNLRACCKSFCHSLHIHVSRECDKVPSVKTIFSFSVGTLALEGHLKGCSCLYASLGKSLRSSSASNRCCSILCKQHGKGSFHCRFRSIDGFEVQRCLFLT